MTVLETVELVEPLSLSVVDAEGSTAWVFEVAIDVEDVEPAESTVLDVGSNAVEVDRVSTGSEVELSVEPLDAGWLGSLCVEVD